MLTNLVSMTLVKPSHWQMLSNNNSNSNKVPLK